MLEAPRSIPPVPEVVSKPEGQGSFPPIDSPAGTLALPPTSRTREKIYFPGLNTVRFFAATAVIVHHLEQLKLYQNLDTLWPNPWIIGLGRSAVSMFFVLSGFLITYLLLVELEKTGSVNVKGFYVRRILRIWPLYYLIVFWGFFILQRLVHIAGPSDPLDQHFSQKLLLFLLILPNVHLVFYKPIIGVSPLWSIGLEEQFYLVWPHLIKRFANGLLFFFVIVVLLKLLAFAGLYWLLNHPQPFGFSAKEFDRLSLVTNIFDYLQVENMTLGGAAAYLYYHGKLQEMRFILRPATKAVTFALVVLLVGYRDFSLHGIAEAVVFSVFIAQIACSPRFWSKREGRRLRYLGNMSYGIYMFHPTLAALVLTWLLKVPALTSSPLLFNLLLYGLVMALTLVVSSISYSYFEAPFLRLKRRFAVVRSGGA
jgi:peptidoglycan/LPS O-acetylase OafA/YrhL